MTIMDEFVRKTEEGIKALKETAEGIALNVEKQAKIAGKKMEVARIQRKIRRVYGEVGEYAYGEYMMNRPIDTNTPYVKDKMNAISEMKLEVERIEGEMESLRQDRAPQENDREKEEEKKEP